MWKYILFPLFCSPCFPHKWNSPSISLLCLLIICGTILFPVLPFWLMELEKVAFSLEFQSFMFQFQCFIKHYGKVFISQCFEKWKLNHLLILSGKWYLVEMSIFNWITINLHSSIVNMITKVTTDWFHHDFQSIISDMRIMWICLKVSFGKMY